MSFATITGTQPDDRGTSFSWPMVKPAESIATSHFGYCEPKYQMPLGCGKAIAAPNSSAATAIQIATRFANTAAQDRRCGNA